MDFKLFKSTPILSIAAYVLVALTTIKIIATVFASPLMAYANNYDFVRQSSCVGIWQWYPDKPKTAPNIQAPVNSLIFDGEIIRTVCMKSSDNLFARITAKLHKKGDMIDFREISFWKISFTLFMFLLLLSRTTDPVHKLAFASAFFLIFGDMVNLLYANTLYMEYSVIAGIFFSLLTTSLLLSTQPKNKTLLVLTGISLVWLGLGKQQYMPLAVIFGIICGAATILKYGNKRAGVGFILIAALMPLIYTMLNQPSSGHMQSVRLANRTDAFMAAVLPMATDKEAALARLGLPARCIDAIGKDWYEPGVASHPPCPEIQHVSEIRLSGLFISEPITFFEPIHKATIGIFPFYPNYLGHLEEPRDSSSRKYLLLKESSLSHVLAVLPKEALTKLLLGSIAVGLLAFASACTSSRMHARAHPLLWMVALGGLVSVYSILSSVFGDGYIEMQKHAVGFLMGIAFQVAAITWLLAGCLLKQVLSRTPSPSRPGATSPSGTPRRSAVRAAVHPSYLSTAQ